MLLIRMDLIYLLFWFTDKKKNLLSTQLHYQQQYKFV